MRYLYVIQDSLDKWSNPQNWVDARTEAQKEEFDTIAFIHVSLGVFFLENFKRMEVSEMPRGMKIVELLLPDDTKVYCKE